MATHVAFLKHAPLDEILAGTKTREFRLSFRQLVCRSVSKGDLLLLKRSGGEVRIEVERSCHRHGAERLSHETQRMKKGATLSLRCPPTPVEGKREGCESKGRRRVAADPCPQS